MLGGWASEGSDRYTRVAKYRIAVMQRAVAEALRKSEDADPLAEADAIDALDEFLSSQGVTKAREISNKEAAQQQHQQEGRAASLSTSFKARRTWTRTPARRRARRCGETLNPTLRRRRRQNPSVFPPLWTPTAPRRFLAVSSNVVCEAEIWEALRQILPASDDSRVFELMFLDSRHMADFLLTVRSIDVVSSSPFGIAGTTTTTVQSSPTRGSHRKCPSAGQAHTSEQGIRVNHMVRRTGPLVPSILREPQPPLPGRSGRPSDRRTNLDMAPSRTTNY